MSISTRTFRILMAVLTAGLAVANGFAQSLRDSRPLQLSEHAQASQAMFDAMQVRLDALSGLKSSSNPWDIYHLAKAQAWLEFAFDSRVQRDASGVIDEALGESDKLTSLLEAKDNSISLDTPIIPSAIKLRDDIWLKAEEMKRHQGLRCAAAKVAQFEVQLVQAGHAHKELGWRHSKPYIQAVERLAKDAAARLDACPPPVTSAEQLPPEVAKQPPAVQVQSLANRVHFAYRAAEISYATAHVLEQVSFVLRTNPEVKVELHGHADKRGSQRYNLKLSRERAEAVKEYLVHSGVVEERISVTAFGKVRPSTKGDGALDYARNRRVEFVVSPQSEVILSPQEEDLQVEQRTRR